MSDREPAIEHLACANDSIDMVGRPNYADGFPVDHMECVEGDIKTV